MGTYTDLLQENIKSAQEELPEQLVKNERTSERAGDRVDKRATERPTERTNGLRTKTNRVKVRNSFEFYQDQVEALKEMQRTAMLNKEEFSMSAVVREALDQYLNKKENRGRSVERSNAWTDERTENDSISTSLNA